MSTKTFAKEWLTAIGCLACGFLLSPWLLCLFLTGNIDSVGIIYVALFSSSEPGLTMLAWLAATGPYLVVQVVRITRWSARYLISRARPASEVEEVGTKIRAMLDTLGETLPAALEEIKKGRATGYPSWRSHIKGAEIKALDRLIRQAEAKLHKALDITKKLEREGQAKEQPGGR